MELFLILLVLLALTRAFGEIAFRLHQPALIGELIAGVALGVTVTAFPHLSPTLVSLPDNEAFKAFTDLGIFFLMLLGGVELRASELAKVSKRGLVIAACGLALPVVTGFGVAWHFLPTSDFKVAQCLFVGTALAITGVPVSIRILMDLGKLHTTVGRTIVSAAIIDDVLSLGLLAVLTSLLKTGQIPDLPGFGALIGQVGVFFALTMLIGRFVVPRIGRIISNLKTSDQEFSSLIIAALAFSVLAEALELHFVLGAFTAGLLFERRVAGGRTYNAVRKRLSAITMGFFAPIFFAAIGMQLDLSAFQHIPLFLTILLIVAFATKMIGAGVPARMLGLSKQDALAVGVGMSARGAVELIIANIALQAGLFKQPSPTPPIIEHLFSAIVIVALVTTIATPFALSFVFGKKPRKPTGGHRSKPLKES